MPSKCAYFYQLQERGISAAQAKQWADKRRVALERARRLREDHSKGQPTEEHTFRPR